MESLLVAPVITFTCTDLPITALEMNSDDDEEIADSKMQM